MKLGAKVVEIDAEEVRKRMVLRNESYEAALRAMRRDALLLVPLGARELEMSEHWDPRTGVYQVRLQWKVPGIDETPAAAPAVVAARIHRFRRRR